MSREGRLYIDDFDSPELILPAAVVAVLFEHGYWAYVREAAVLPPSALDEYEDDEVPADRLPMVAIASQDFAKRYEGQDRTHTVVRAESSDGLPTESVWTVENEVVREAIFAIGALAMRAHDRGRSLTVSL